jgi:hypothetical protein
MVATPLATGAAQSSTSTVTSTIARPGGVGDNDLLLAWVSTQGTITAPSGWTSLGVNTTPSYNKSQLFWRRAGAGVVNYPFTTSAGHSIDLLAIPGAADPVAGEYQVTATQTATCSVGQANSWVFSFTSLGTTSTVTPAGTDTVRDTRSGAYSTIKIQNLAQDTNGAAVATGSVTKTFTGTSNVTSVASAIVVLRSSGTAFTRTIADTIGVTDNDTQVVAYARSVADSIGVTDGIYGPAAAGAYDLYPTNANPGVSFGGAGYTLGLLWDVTGYGKSCSAIKSWVQPAAGSPLTAKLWRGSDLVLLSSATVPGTPVAADVWTTTPLPALVPLDPTDFYIVAIYYANGGPVGPAGLPPSQGPLHPGSAAFGGGDVIPTSLLNSQSYAITPVVVDSPTVTTTDLGRRLLLAC